MSFFVAPGREAQTASLPSLLLTVSSVHADLGSDDHAAPGFSVWESLSEPEAPGAELLPASPARHLGTGLAL